MRSRCSARSRLRDRGLAVICERNILGDRLVRRRRAPSARNFIAEATSLGFRDLVVHVDHGIGRFVGLQTIMAPARRMIALTALRENAKLYLPVENIDCCRVTARRTPRQVVRSSRLAGWQTRKAKLKNRSADGANS